jgi:asparagine synthase (glutamine-hydrolysing)
VNKQLVLAANGEIYNRECVNNLKASTTSNRVIAKYFSFTKKRTSFIDEMNGIFLVAIYDVEKDEYFVARDHMGIIPLYIGWDEHGTFMWPELKALEGYCTKSIVSSNII